MPKMQISEMERQERRKRTVQKYREKHKEEISRKAKNWRLNNRDWYFEYIKNNKEKIKQRKRKYVKSRIKEILAKQKEKRKNKPDQYMARTKITYLRQANKINPKNKCEICFQYKTTVAHHQDYSKPMDVKWVCKRCHHILHTMYKIWLKGILPDENVVQNRGTTNPNFCRCDFDYSNGFNDCLDEIKRRAGIE